MQPNYLRNFHKRISKDDLKAAKSSGKQGGSYAGKICCGWLGNDCSSEYRFLYDEIMSKFSIMQNLMECFSNMVGKNNNYVRESKSNEHFQRFALRKLSVGVVSVAVAAGFYLGSGTTAQAATAESDASAKTEQVVQQDANSTASDSTSASNSSAAMSTSSATPVSAESASSAAVSDSPASASSASDSQASAANASEISSQPASSSVASDAAATVSKRHSCQRQPLMPMKAKPPIF